MHFCLKINNLHKKMTSWSFDINFLKIWYLLCFQLCYYMMLRSANANTSLLYVCMCIYQNNLFSYLSFWFVKVTFDMLFPELCRLSFTSYFGVLYPSISFLTHWLDFCFCFVIKFFLLQFKMLTWKFLFRLCFIFSTEYSEFYIPYFALLKRGGG